MKRAPDDFSLLTHEQAGAGAFAVLGVIMKMSDDAQAAGGATCIAGVASLNRMQSSIQASGPRLAGLLRRWSETAPEAG